MPKLSEVLGGIVKDVMQAQFTGDMQVIEHLAIYQEHALLKHLPVPRVRIKDIHLNLRFAISESTDSGISDNAKVSVSNVWVSHLNTSLLPSLFSNLIKDDEIYKVVKPVIEKEIRNKTMPVYDGNMLLKGKFGDAIKTTEDFVATIVRSLPSDVRSNLPNLQIIRNKIRRTAKTALDSFKPTFKKVAIAKSVQDFDLDVLVTKNELQGLTENEYQELSFTLSIEDSAVGME